ncbi:uncharacterized protein LOC118197404 isoform X2 [Stegodyphus dumicola]|nr:uncharacterized protein LOC118197404 isoform X2 [Stegodyphus dumicola]
MILALLMMFWGLASAVTGWGDHHHDYENHVDEPQPSSHLQSLDVVCSKDHMTVNMKFDEPFYGVVFSHPSGNHERCIHVGPRTGILETSFRIGYDSCGTVEDLRGQFHENTIVIQFGEDILEAWDEAKRLRCEWLESFEKPSSKPSLAISDLDVVELNFQGDDIDCWMEVQEGKGPWARQVGGLVPIGSPLTLVIAINDHSREFDLRVKRCSASDGAGIEVQLTDQNGCVLRPSLLTPFAKIRDYGPKATLIAYSHLYAFKFPDNLDVFVHCIVEVCRNGCPDSCSRHSLDNAYASPREPYDALESKKHQKLVELANSKPSQPSSHLPLKQHGPYLTKVPVSLIKESYRESLTAAASQKQVHHISFNNASLELSSPGKHKISDGKHLTSAEALHKAESTSKEVHSTQAKKVESSASSIHLVFDNVKNNIHDHHNNKFDSHLLEIHKDAVHEFRKHTGDSSASYERNIDSDAHLNSGQHPPVDEHYIAHYIHPSKEVAKQIPQPEPASWSGEDVRPVSKQQINDQHSHTAAGLATLHDSQITLQQKHQIQTKHIQNPGPDFHLNLDAMKSNINPELYATFISHLPANQKSPPQEVHSPQPILVGGHRKIIGHDAYWNPDELKKTEEHHVKHIIHTPKEILTPAPQPEPASWSADDVKPLIKEEVYHDRGKLNERVQQNAQVHNIHLTNKDVPIKPAPWTFEEVNPMINPAAPRPILTKPPLPRPEPSSWTLDDVKPLTKEDLKVHSLNYKMPVQPQTPIPLYKELVQPYGIRTPSTPPQPIYIPTPGNNSPNMSNPAMMKMMMMMMPTLLPVTYQTARWPQKTTARFLRPNRQHYPYPIPQFSPRQQMMMSIIADRRMDDDESELQYEMPSDENHKNVETENSGIAEGRSPVFTETIRQIGGLFTSELNKEPNKSEKLQNDSSGIKPVLEDVFKSMLSEIPTLTTLRNNPEEFATTAMDELGTENATAVKEKPIREQLISTGQNISEEKRPPVSGFVPPKLDNGDTDSQPQINEKPAHGPRALDRRKRSSEPVFGVRQKFQAIALSDLAFDFNLTSESTTLLRGRREEIIYGICMSPASMSASVGLILILTLCSIIASAVLYEHSCRLSNKTSHLSLLTRTFNGRLEALYRISRPHATADSAT